jgi:hypothetical protein
MLKTFTPSPDMVRAAESVFLAKAHLEMITPIVDAYQRQALQHLNAAAAERWHDVAPAGPILEPAQAFLLADGDFKTYIDMTRQSRQAAGLVVDDEEQCPLLVAQALLVEAERLLLVATEPVSGISATRADTFKVADRRRLIDLALRLLAPFVRDANALLDGIGISCPPRGEQGPLGAQATPQEGGAAAGANAGAAAGPGACQSFADRNLQ